VHKNPRRGCQSCFCNGLEVTCHTSHLFYEKITAAFDEEIESWQVTDRYMEHVTHVDSVANQLEFTRFDEFTAEDQADLFFLVPDKFKNNKLNSYGGNLSFRVFFKTSGSVDEPTRPFEIRIAVCLKI
jgi:hypothetical protein